jgi:hypothetical protein
MDLLEWGGVLLVHVILYIKGFFDGWLRSRYIFAVAGL